MPDEGKKERDEKEDKKDPHVRVVDRRWWAREDRDSAEADISSGRKPTYVEDLERQLSDARTRIQELGTARRQSVEEFEQARLRMRREVGREVERGRRTILAELLDVLDNLDRAIAASRDADQSTGSSGVEQLLRGVELVRTQFLGKLEGYGVNRVPALGQPFDTARHEAVTTAHVEDAGQDGVVISVIREGYTIGDELLRPAAVVVGRHAASE
jgi:molecular chaperone GrpE